MRSDLIAVLDLGSTKVACFVAHLENNGIKVTGIGHQVSHGIRAGIVIDIKQAEKAILSAVSAAEKMAGETIDKVYVNVSGTTLESHVIDVETSISGHEVTEKDINQVIAQGKKQFESDDFEIIHCLPGQYRIDDSAGIHDPRGMFGNGLSSKLHVVRASATATRNIVNCLARCHLNVEEFVAAPYASALACLSEDEKNVGVTLVEIGGGCTSIAIVVGGHFTYTDTVPIGGNHITKDVAIGLSTSSMFAERIKTLYGSAIATSHDQREMIDVPFLDNEELGPESEDMDAEVVQVPRSALTAIIKPRVEEIFELVKGKIKTSPFGHVVGSRVVLTGGTAQLAGIKELASHVFSKQVRIGRPIFVDGLAESTRGAAFSCPVGMLKYAASRQVHSRAEIININSLSKKGQIDKVLRWFQQNF